MLIGCPRVVFATGDFFFGCPCCRFWEGGMFCGCPGHYRRQEECLLDARGLFLRRGGGVLWLPRSLCETGAMGRCWDGILGYFCNVFSWAKSPASKLVGGCPGHYARREPWAVVGTVFSATSATFSLGQNRLHPSL